MDIPYKNIIFLGKKLGKKTKKDIGSLIGATSQQMSNWASRGVPSDKIPGIAKRLDVTIDKLLNEDLENIQYQHTEYSPQPVSEDMSNAYIVKTKKVPIISMVAAGNWSECHDPYPIGNGDGEVDCEKCGENAFAVKVVGISMEPRFHEGDIVICDPSQWPENKDLVIAKLTNSNEATFKQLIIEDGQMMLKALNPSWPNQIIPINEDCHIIGKVVQVVIEL